MAKGKIDLRPIKKDREERKIKKDISKQFGKSVGKEADLQKVMSWALPMINFLTKNPAGKIVKFLGGAATGGALVPIIQGLLTTIGSAGLEKFSRSLGAGGKKEDIDVEDRYGWAKESIKESKEILSFEQYKKKDIKC